MPITDLAAKNAKPTERPYKMQDSGGLFLLVATSGSKLWRMKYRFTGKEKLLSFGQYPSVSLAEARRKRDDAKKQLSEGRDPSEVKKETKRSYDLEGKRLFEKVAREWFQKKEGALVSTYSTRIWSRVEKDLLPHLGKTPIEVIEPPEVLSTIRKIEARGSLVMAKRVLNYASQIFKFAVASGYVKRDPTQDIRGALEPVKTRNKRSALKHSGMSDFMENLADYDGDELTRLALTLLVHTFVRTSEIRFAVWPEFELEGNEPVWRIPAERMKMRQAHIVPLTPQAVAVLKDIKALGLKSNYLFPSATVSKVISENTMLYAMYRMGYKSRATVHGFRSTASTLLNEVGFNRDWIERQLAHADKDEIRDTYNAAEYLPQRRGMMMWWSIFLAEGTTDHEKP